MCACVCEELGAVVVVLCSQPNGREFESPPSPPWPCCCGFEQKSVYHCKIGTYVALTGVAKTAALTLGLIDGADLGWSRLDF